MYAPSRSISGGWLCLCPVESFVCLFVGNFIIEHNFGISTGSHYTFGMHLYLTKPIILRDGKQDQGHPSRLKYWAPSRSISGRVHFEYYVESFVCLFVSSFTVDHYFWTLQIETLRLACMLISRRWTFRGVAYQGQVHPACHIHVYRWNHGLTYWL